MSKNARKLLMLIVCSIINILLIFLLIFIGNKLQIIRFSKTLFIPATSLQGTIQALISLICLLIVFIDFRKGKYISYGLLSMVACHDVITLYMKKILTPLPGIFSVIISFITVSVLYKFYSKQAENSITDFVTGLFNRRKFVEDTESLVTEKKPFFLANVAIRDFGKIVDSYGLKAGDYVLKKFSDRILATLSPAEKFYRIGGSNFTIVYSNNQNPLKAVEQLEEKVKQEILIPKSYSVSGNTEASCYPVLICGISQFDGINNNYATIFNQSELALSMARKNPNQNIYFYDEKMKQDQDNQYEAEKLIIESINNDYFYLVYQPQFEIAQKKLRGFETLIRCKKPDGTIVSPGFYIPVAERSNLILDIDDYVLKRSMKEFKPVLDSIKEKITISINVSAKNFSKENFTQKVFALAQETQFPLDCLEIEITEYSLAESLETTIKNIQILREKNVQIALDDFGTGYTSMAQLMNLPINLLKIDKSLIDGVTESKRSKDLVDSVIYMGHIMNCEVISEGVEEETQLEFLKNHKCDFVQGFIWGKPMSYEDAVNLTRKQ